MQESIYERFMERAIRRVESIRSGNPLDSVTQMGAQVSHGQLETILNYIDIGKKRGRRRAHWRGGASCWKVN
ncbi:lactaldehyde dehydrogenase [Escherichia coli]|uniref:Lactaldehyde dehydrogenase n=1 Tax=Escherichia coli TaxID=562 RepID=A0A377AJD8_ECOLX|nr:lactaldehyde dehydrogenase [Escherichia coli]